MQGKWPTPHGEHYAQLITGTCLQAFWSPNVLNGPQPLWHSTATTGQIMVPPCVLPTRCLHHLNVATLEGNYLLAGATLIASHPLLSAMTALLTVLTAMFDKVQHTTVLDYRRVLAQLSCRSRIVYDPSQSLELWGVPNEHELAVCSYLEDLWLMYTLDPDVRYQLLMDPQATKCLNASPVEVILQAQMIVGSVQMLVTDGFERRVNSMIASRTSSAHTQEIMGSGRSTVTTGKEPFMLVL